MNVFKKNKTLFLGLSIPMFMIIFVVASIYIPPLFIKPKHNFIYVSSSYLGRNYSVEGGKLVKAAVINYSDSSDYTGYGNGYPTLYYYDVSKDTSNEISFEDAQDITIDSNTISQDGFEVKYGGGNGGGFPFYNSPSSSSMYITGNGMSKKINLRTDSTNYYGFQLIGWVK